MIKNNRGMALSLVIMLMAIMSILGLIFLQLSVFQTKHAARDRSKMQAYYLAKSGVEATVAWMMDPSNDGAHLIGKTSAPAVLSGGNVDGNFVVEVLGDTSSALLVKGTGNVNGVSSDATMFVRRHEMQSDQPVFENTLYATTIITVGGNTNVYGSIAAGVAINENGKALYVRDGMEIIKKVFPSVLFPAYPNDQDITFSNDTNLLDITIMPDQVAVYRNFGMKGGNTVLNINTGEVGNVVNLVVDTLDLQNGKIFVMGQGRLHIFVKTKVNLGPVHVNYDFHPKSVFLFIGDGTSPSYFSYSGGAKFNGFIYAPDAVISLTGNGQIIGAVIAGTAEVQGTPFGEHSYGMFDDITFEFIPTIGYTKGSWVNN